MESVLPQMIVQCPYFDQFLRMFYDANAVELRIEDGVSMPVHSSTKDDIAVHDGGKGDMVAVESEVMVDNFVADGMAVVLLRHSRLVVMLESS